MNTAEKDPAPADKFFVKFYILSFEYLQLALSLCQRIGGLSNNNNLLFDLKGEYIMAIHRKILWNCTNTVIKNISSQQLKAVSLSLNTIREVHSPG
jgi:hypothetical protein